MGRKQETVRIDITKYRQERGSETEVEGKMWRHV